MARKGCWALVLLWVGIALSGCSSEADPPTRQEAENAVETLLPEQVEPVNPPGMKKPRVWREDMDGDGAVEAVTVFREKKQNGRVGVLVARRDEDHRWSAQTRFLDKKSGKVDQLALRDMTGDRRPELLLGMEEPGAREKNVTVMRYRGNRWETLWEAKYDRLLVDDLDEDRKPEVFLLTSQDTQGSIELYQHRKNGWVRTDDFKIDAMHAFLNIQVGFMEPKKRALFVDIGLGAHSGQTCLFQVKDGRLREYFTRYPQAADKIIRPYPQISQDINGDGIVEIPSFEDASAIGDLSMVETPWVTTWYQAREDGSLRLVSKTYSDHGFRFDIPKSWYGKFEIYKHMGPDDRYLSQDPVFGQVKAGADFLYKTEGPENPVVLSLLTFPKERWPSVQPRLKEYEKGNRITVWDASADYVVVALVPKTLPDKPARPMLLSEAEVRKRVHVETNDSP